MKTIKRKHVPVCAPELLKYAYECGNAASVGRMALPSFDSRGSIEIEGFGVVRVSDTPLARFFHAISEHASEGLDQHMAISFRLIALFKIIGELGDSHPLIRRVPVGFEIHPLLFDVAASCPANDRGCFSLRSFQKLAITLAKESSARPQRSKPVE